MFAPIYHSGMKNVAKVRQTLKVKTIFNILGPLSNPAGVKRQLIGVYKKSLLPTVIHTAKDLGMEHVMVVHSDCGMDEVSLYSKTNVAELKNGNIDFYNISPDQFGFNLRDSANIYCNNSLESLNLVKQSLTDIKTDAFDIVALNAGVSLYISGLAQNILQGTQMALEVVKNGVAYNKFKEFIKLSNEI